MAESMNSSCIPKNDYGGLICSILKKNVTEPSDCYKNETLTCYMEKIGSAANLIKSDNPELEEEEFIPIIGNNRTLDLGFYRSHCTKNFSKSFKNGYLTSTYELPTEQPAPTKHSRSTTTHSDEDELSLMNENMNHYILRGACICNDITNGHSSGTKDSLPIDISSPSSNISSHLNQSSNLSTSATPITHTSLNTNSTSFHNSTHVDNSTQVAGNSTQAAGNLTDVFTNSTSPTSDPNSTLTAALSTVSNAFKNFTSPTSPTDFSGSGSGDLLDSGSGMSAVNRGFPLDSSHTQKILQCVCTKKIYEPTKLYSATSTKSTKTTASPTISTSTSISNSTKNSTEENSFNSTAAIVSTESLNRTMQNATDLLKNESDSSTATPTSIPTTSIAHQLTSTMDESGSGSGFYENGTTEATVSYRSFDSSSHLSNKTRNDEDIKCPNFSRYLCNSTNAEYNSRQKFACEIVQKPFPFESHVKCSGLGNLDETYNMYFNKSSPNYIGPPDVKCSHQLNSINNDSGSVEKHVGNDLSTLLYVGMICPLLLFLCFLIYRKKKSNRRNNAIPLALLQRNLISENSNSSHDELHID